MTNLIKHSSGYYELLTDTNISFLIELNDSSGYSVTMLEDDNAVDDIGEFNDIKSAIIYLENV